MGCQESQFREADTSGATTFTRRETKVLKRLAVVEQFEFTFPFYRLRIDKYEGCIKRFVNKDDNGTVTLRQLQYAFQEEDSWSCLNDETSVLFRLFNQPELKDDENPERLSVAKLMCVGLMLCGGTNELKSRVLYDVLQDNMQQKISSSDKDFATTCRHMIVLDVYMMLKVYREEASAEFLTKWYPQPGTQLFENVLEEFKEMFLDEIFGNESNLSRG